MKSWKKIKLFSYIYASTFFSGASSFFGARSFSHTSSFFGAGFLIGAFIPSLRARAK
jgi:hypothetical protein